MHPGLTCLAFAALAGAHAAVTAAPAAPITSVTPIVVMSPQEDWIAVDDDTLERARGGFDLGGGLMLSLGIERLVSINGNPVASSTFNISDVARATPAQARLAGEALSAVTLVQNGAGNVYQADAMGQGLGALVIQNSANDQLIRSQTTISTSVNSMSLLKQLNFENSLRDALSGAAVPR